MGIEFDCVACGQHITAPEALAGQGIVCPNPTCGCRLVVPASEPSEVVIDPDNDIVFDCPFCGHELVVSKKGAGLNVPCPECGKLVAVPALASVSSSWVPPPPPSVASVPRTASPAASPCVAAPALALPVLRAEAVPCNPVNPVPQTPQHNRSNNMNMMVEEMDFRSAIKQVVQTVIVIVALSVLKAIICSFLPDDVVFRSLSLGTWVDMVVTFVIVGLIIKIYRPIETIATFYLSAFIKVGKLPGREKYLGNLIVIAEKLTLLIFVSSIYSYLRPFIQVCNQAFLRVSMLSTLLDVCVVIAAVGILLLIWKQARPLVELLTGHITNTVSNLSNSIVYVACPACGANNDRDAAFCASCGAKMAQPAAPTAAQASNSKFCSQCGTENPPSGKFCFKCGTPLS